MFSTSRNEFALFSLRVNEAYENRLDAIFAKGQADKRSGLKFTAFFEGRRLFGTERSVYYSAYKNAAAPVAA
jgi:hypothetical protein